MNLESRIEKLEARQRERAESVEPFVMIRRKKGRDGMVAKCYPISFPYPCDAETFSATMGSEPTDPRAYRSRAGCDLANECGLSHRCRADGRPVVETAT